MCVISLATVNNRADTVNTNKLKFIALLNRDEQQSRTTLLPTHNTHIISAVDGLHGGTSCGLNSTTGIYVALTNVHDPSALVDSTYVSRGLLVNTLLNLSIAEFNNLCHNYNTIKFNYKLAGFNCVIVDLFSTQPTVLYITNRIQHNIEHKTIYNMDFVINSNNPVHATDGIIGRSVQPIDINHNTVHTHQYAYIQILDSSTDAYTINGFSNGYLNDVRFQRAHKLNHKLNSIIHQYCTMDIHNNIEQLIDTAANALCDTTYDKQVTPNICDNATCINASNAILLNNPRDIDAIKLASQLIFVPTASTIHKHVDSTTVEHSVDPNKVWATRSQTIVVATYSNVYMYYRTTPSYPITDIWHKFNIPIAV